MPTCKICGNVVGVTEIEDGFCQSCVSVDSVAKAIAVEESSVESSVEREIASSISNLKNPFSFRGKSGRLDYLLYGVFLGLGLMLLGFYLGITFEQPAFIFGFVFLGGIISLAAMVRRCRDRNENIFLVLILSAIPYLGFFVTLFLLLAPGVKEKDINKTDEKEKK